MEKQTNLFDKPTPPPPTVPTQKKKSESDKKREYVYQREPKVKRLSLGEHAMYTDNSKVREWQLYFDAYEREYYLFSFFGDVWQEIFFAPPDEALKREIRAISSKQRKPIALDLKAERKKLCYPRTFVGMMARDIDRLLCREISGCFFDFWIEDYEKKAERVVDKFEKADIEILMHTIVVRF